MMRMTKTTVDLPEELSRQVENTARLEGRSKSAVIRQAVEEAMQKRARPKPRIPLFTKELPEPDMAERVDEFLKGFGSDR
jgi:Arc/MetJ-type ribon-helix-helix transcriptional regulator